MENMKKIVMLFLATMVLAGASFATQAATGTDNAMKSDAKTDTAAPKKEKKAKKEKAPKAAKTKKTKKDKAAATTDAAPAAAPAK
jgi:hypothetical protein